MARTRTTPIRIGFQLSDSCSGTVPGDEAQRVVDRVVRVGIKAILNFAPTQLQAPADVTVKTVNMAMELEGLSFALSNRD